MVAAIELKSFRYNIGFEKDLKVLASLLGDIVVHRLVHTWLTAGGREDYFLRKEQKQQKHQGSTMPSKKS